MKTAKMIISAVATMAVTAISGGVRAEDFSSTNVQFQYGVNSKADPVVGNGTNNEKLTWVRFEHFGTHAYGDNYLALDVFKGGDIGGAGAGSFGASTKYQSLLIYMPRFSLSKISGETVGIGPLADVGLTTRFELGTYGNYRAIAPGISLTWKVPGFAYFETAGYMRSSNFSNGHPLLRVVYIAPFEVAGVKFTTDGLLLVSKPDNLGTMVIYQPELRFGIDPKSRLELGVRLEYARYKSGGSVYERTTPLAMLRWNW